jgi:protein-S-isoprenylcysteine O-methyltransferase Ste14
VGKAIVETIVFGIILGASIFLPAETLHWPMAWGVIAFYFLYAIAGFLLLPADLIDERSHFPQGASFFDLALSGSAFVLSLPVALIVCGLDRRLHWSPAIPLEARLTAAAIAILGYTLALFAARENRFFSAVVRVQDDRGHRVVATGPYAWVRHPGYAGAIATHLILPLALGSLWGLLPAMLGSVLLALRIPYEEGVLRSGLAGYSEYTERVRWRLFPGLW